MTKKDATKDITKDIQSMIEKLNERMKALGEERDRLDDAIAEAEELRHHVREAFDHLQDARDALSRLV